MLERAGGLALAGWLQRWRCRILARQEQLQAFTQIIDVWATAVGVIISNNITDIIRYGDSRPVHALAIKVLIERLSKESEIKTGVGLQMLTKFQGTFASQSHRWR